MQFANNAVTTLASGITNVATSMTVTSAVAFPTLTGAQYFYCTLIDAATGLVIEIVKVTAVVASVFTIVRGQDGTTASAYITGDKVELRLVRAELNDFPKLDEDNTFTGVLTANSYIPSSSTIPTNGMYLPATNSVGLATNSTERMRIFSSGGVSIGNTTDPGATNLSVTGTIVPAVGAVATPSIRHTTNAATGMWFPSVNQVAFSANGSQNLSITPSGVNVNGSVGLSIGVAGNAAATSINWGTNGTGLYGSSTAVNCAVSGTNVWSTTAASFAVTGAISTVGVAATGVASITSTGTTTAYNVWSINNTGNTAYFGVDNSVGNAFSGSTAYATVIGSNGATNVHFITSGAVKATIFASGGMSLGNITDPGATNLSVTGSITSAATTSGSSTTGAFAYGTLGYSDTNHLASFQSSVNTYNQVEIQNTNSGASASADLVVSNNLTTASTYYGNVGINSSGFTGTGSFNLPNAVYLSSTGGATSSDLVLGTTTSTAPGAIHFVINSGTTDAGSISTAGRWAINNSTTNTTPTALLHIGAGTATASTAPLKLTSGTNLTTVEAGAIEYDGVNFYATAETTSGRNVIPEYQQFYLSSNVTAFGPASGDFFGATSSASLAATTSYDIECYCYFLKTTAGTGQWIPTFSTALTVGHSYLEYTPVTGFTTTVITGAMVVAEATQQTTAVLTHAATASLTTAVSHIAKLKIRVLTNTACNFRLKFVGSAGTITPQTGSWYTVRKVASNAGNFVA